MNRAELRDISSPPQPILGWTPKVHRACFGLFLLQLALVWARLWLPHPPFPDAHWPEGVLVLAATATILASLCRQLPGQNTLLASIDIAAIAGAILTLGALTGIPFGPFVYDNAMGPRLFSVLPWAAPLIWIVAVLSSRGVARLILWRWPRTPNYGLWLIGLTVLLVVLLDFGLEPFATQVLHFWHWNPVPICLAWYSTPCTNFLGWAVTALLILALATPALINKRPSPQPPPDSHPLMVWLLTNLLFATGAMVHRLWAAALLGLVVCLGVAALALWGARPPHPAESA